MFNQNPEEGIMPKLFLKSFAVRTCALACVAGLSINTFAFAGSSNSTASLSLRRSARTLMPLQNPSPTPPARAGISPGKDNQAMQADQGKRYGQSGFVGEPINLNVVNADIRDILNYVTRSEEHTSELQSQSNLVCRLLLEKKKLESVQTAMRP